ncbi:hypothetical protein Btru_046128 [Bulinus truncatus]|nr:hypothetical protein Btru_046128 [Bulinus truncatus]
MDCAVSFSWLITDFKSKLEKRKCPLRGQLTFTISDSPEVDVMFLPSASLLSPNRVNIDDVHNENESNKVHTTLFNLNGIHSFVDVIKKHSLTDRNLNELTHTELVSVLNDILQSLNINLAQGCTEHHNCKICSGLFKMISTFIIKNVLAIKFNYSEEGTKCLKIENKEKRTEESKLGINPPYKNTRRKGRKPAKAEVHKDEAFIKNEMEIVEHTICGAKKNGKHIHKDKADENQQHLQLLGAPAHSLKLRTCLREVFSLDNDKCLSVCKKMQINDQVNKDLTRKYNQIQGERISFQKSSNFLTEPQESIMKSHMSGFQCDICGKTLKSKDSLYHHQRGLHSNVKHYSCSQCDATFNFYHSYKLHVQRHQGQRPHRCQVCQKTYLTSNHLKVHTEATHKVRKKVCHICGKIFSYSCSLKTHLQKHTGYEPFKCDQCDKTFTSKQSLTSHRLSHDLAKHHTCDTCGKSYKSEHSKNVHMKSHEKQKQIFMCEFCSKTFCFRSALTAHLNIHSKVRPYLCSQCGKSFKSKTSLYSHKYVHREIQSFNCTTCGKAFKTKSCCSAHMKRHISQPTFPCSLCGSVFPDKGGLSKHMKTIHKPRKQYICKICGKKGTRGDNMRTHVKNHKKDLNESINPNNFIEEEDLVDTEVGQLTVRPRIRGPKQRGAKALHIKDILQKNKIKDNPPSDDTNNLSNEQKPQPCPLLTLQPSLLTLMESSQLSFMTGDSFLHCEADNSDTSLVQADHHESTPFQNESMESNKTPFYLTIMQQPSEFPATDTITLVNLVSAVNPMGNREPVTDNSDLPSVCPDSMILPHHTSASQMHPLAMSCIYSDAEEGNITPLHEILSRDNTMNNSSLL